MFSQRQHKEGFCLLTYHVCLELRPLSYSELLLKGRTCSLSYCCALDFLSLLLFNKWLTSFIFSSYILSYVCLSSSTDCSVPFPVLCRAGLVAIHFFSMLLSQKGCLSPSIMLDSFSRYIKLCDNYDVKSLRDVSPSPS